MYNTIQNPVNGNYVDIDSKLGKQIMKKYILQLKGGFFSTKKKTNEAKKIAEKKYTEAKQKAEEKYNEAKKKAEEEYHQSKVKAEEKIDEVKHKAEEKYHEAEEKIDEVKHKAEEKYHEAEEKLDEVKDQVEEKYHESQEKLEEAKNKAKDSALKAKLEKDRIAWESIGDEYFYLLYTDEKMKQVNAKRLEKIQKEKTDELNRKKDEVKRLLKDVDEIQKLEKKFSSEGNYKSAKEQQYEKKQKLIEARKVNETMAEKERNGEVNKRLKEVEDKISDQMGGNIINQFFE